MGIKYYVAFFEADEEKLKELNSTFDDEMVWVQESGISMDFSLEVNEDSFNDLQIQLNTPQEDENASIS